MRVLLLSAYAAVSHRYWAERLMSELDDLSWTCLSLPPRHFAWRIRGNPLSWWLKERDTLNQSFDVVLATSMVDLATLLGLFPHLAAAHKVVYFHENQLAYPVSSQQGDQVEAKMVNLYTALAADTLIFNSAFNRDSFFTGARQFLKKMPENLPIAEPLEQRRGQALVLPVPLRCCTDNRLPAPRPARIIWNHRWEYDKNPDAFFNVLFRLNEARIPFELAVLGQRFRDTPPIFAEAEQRLARHIIYWGPQPEATYRALLGEGGVVISTTWHEFQGLSIMEAAQAGGLPLVPDRLCFPEFYPSAYRYDGSEEGLFQRLHSWLTRPDTQPGRLGTEQWEWPAWRDAYRLALAGRGRAGH